MTKDTGGPAFPCKGPFEKGLEKTSFVYPGMLLRDHFAGQALAIAWKAQEAGYYEGGAREIAECAYQLADAMILERSKP